ncbi:hypothetical protein TeGR_g2536 [Tetraparma gracilis]|uniref:Nucleotide-diphospho-sugar transferase domain-containing protein n=1 Tax=Tetraparma gracilis TaxID=2962635 RepID=A0ABQ6MQ75_9STRA|nr:hypothetical protein TeGR_g2536 [Tetraparma gracilis]
MAGFRHHGAGPPKGYISVSKVFLFTLLTSMLSLWLGMFITSPMPSSLTAAGSAKERADLGKQLAASEARVARLNKSLEDEQRKQQKPGGATYDCPKCTKCTKCDCPEAGPPSSVPSSAQSWKVSDVSDFGKTAWGRQGMLEVEQVLDGSYGVDLGIPPLKGYRGNEQAMVMYHESAAPSSPSAPPLENCKEVDVVITKRNDKSHCLVVMEHYQAYHLHRFMRKPAKGPADMKQELRRVELLANFVCAANAKNVDTGNVVVFATDVEARTATEKLGLHVFYDEEGGFGDLPTDEAKAYGDATFTAMMYIKVLAVYLPMMLGYEVLFQDVDVVWHENPLPYFADKSRCGDFDTYFSDDGARSMRYAPFSANSGFYFLRNNDKTTYLMTSLLYAGDSIIKTHSHQQTLISILTEHNSLYGLSVKVLNTDEFPGGKQYHHEKDYMLKWMQGEVEPIMYHMCWTANKDDKILYMQQMGEWFLEEKCGGDAVRSGGSDPLACCSAEPMVKCHFKDKPSIVKCDSSPNKDKGGKSFW